MDTSVGVVPLDRPTASEYASWFRALADGTRVQIVSLLARAGRPMSVGEIVSAVAVGQSTVSAHLKVLAEVRFVLAEQRGTARFYRVNDECVACFPTAADVVMGRSAPTRPHAGGRGRAEVGGSDVELARRHAAEAGVTNVEFRVGYLEAIPLPDAAVDVVISNCVFTLSTDKPRALAETARVLRPGDRLGITDVLAEPDLDPARRAAAEHRIGSRPAGDVPTVG